MRIGVAADAYGARFFDKRGSARYTDSDGAGELRTRLRGRGPTL